MSSPRRRSTMSQSCDIRSIFKPVPIISVDQHPQVKRGSRRSTGSRSSASVGTTLQAMVDARGDGGPRGGRGLR